MTDNALINFNVCDNAHEICEAAVDHVLENVNTIQYIVKSIEEITHIPFTRNRIKCISASPTHKKYSNPENNSSISKCVDLNSEQHKRGADNERLAGLTFDMKQTYAGYMWRRARQDAEKGDIVLIEEQFIPLVNKKNSNKFVKQMQESIWQDDVNNNSININNSDNDSNERSNEQPEKSFACSSNSNYWRQFVNTQQSILEQTERNLRHELIHAFDDARGEIDSNNCLHQACSEIRAARLSGDCLVGQELKKGRFNYLEGAMNCVERRATLAVEVNPICRGFANRAVTSMMRKCYTDSEPFISPLYTLGSHGSDTFHNGTINSNRESYSRESL